jgi:integrase
MRTNEWVAAERRDLDRAGRAVVVQRRYADGLLTPFPKTARSRRRIPLSGRALAAIEALPPRLDTPLLFPAAEGGYISLGNWRNRRWYDALDAAGIERRGPYHLRHTFATESLAAGVSLFELARLMGTSIAMIDRTYGHLARDSEEAIRARFDARADRSGVFSASDGTAEQNEPRETGKRSVGWGCQLRAGTGSPRVWAVMTWVR